MTDFSPELQDAIDVANRAEARLERLRAMTDSNNPLTRTIGRVGVRLTRSSVIYTNEHVDMLFELAALERRSSLE